MNSLNSICIMLLPISLFSQTNQNGHTKGVSEFPRHNLQTQATFAPVVTYNSGGQIASTVVTADVNRDGKLDLVVSNDCPSKNSCSNGVVGILLGNGDGTFQPAVTYPSGGFDAVNLVATDVNDDGKLDLVVANICVDSNCNSTGSVTLLLGNGDGTFQPPMAIADYGGHNSYFSVAVADVNGDKKPDLVVSNGCTHVRGNGSCTSKGEIEVLLGNGDGTFHVAGTFATGGYYAIGLSVADLNGDGKPDVLVANRCQPNVAVAGCAYGTVGVLLGNGDGTFQAPRVYWSAGRYSSDIAVADVNGDGHSDLLVSNGCASGISTCNGGTIGVLLGNGDGTFQPAVAYSSGGESPTSVAIADVNGDNIPDLVVANNCALGCTPDSDGVAAVLLGKGNGTFEPPVVYDSGALSADGLAVADLNGDGKPDIAMANYYPLSGDGGVVGVLINTSPSTIVTGIVTGLTSPTDPPQGLPPEYH